MDALDMANRNIHDRTITEVDKQGMGTTASVLIVSGTRYIIGQVGDSRVYLLATERSQQLTQGPLLRAGAGRRRVSDAGAGALPSVQQRHHALCRREPRRAARHLLRATSRVGDLFLVASDGLTGMVDDRRLQMLLMSRAEPERKVHALISEANGRGGLDNITAIVVQIEPEDDGAGDGARKRSAR